MESPRSHPAFVVIGTDIRPFSEWRGGSGQSHSNEATLGFERKTACEAKRGGEKRITRVRKSGRGF